MIIRNLPERWDMEADLVAVGSGAGGFFGGDHRA